LFLVKPFAKCHTNKNTRLIALATAGLKKYIKQNNIAGENLVAIVSGANVNFENY
jgi:hypothetical protein